MKDVHKITLTDYEAKIGVQANDIIPVEEQNDGHRDRVVVTKVKSKRGPGRPPKSLSRPPPPPPIAHMDIDDQNEEIVLEGIDPTTAAMPKP